MNRAKKILGILIVVLAIVGIGYAIYLAVNGTRNDSVKTVAEADDEGLKLLYGDLGADIQYIADPTKVDYGINQYPGAAVSSNEKLSFQGKVNQSELTVGTFTTQDTVDEVMQYYKTQFGSTAKTGDIKSSDYSFTYYYVTSEADNASVVIVYRKTTETIIHLVRSGL